MGNRERGWFSGISSGQGPAVGSPEQYQLTGLCPQVARTPLKEFDKEKAWRAVVVQMAQ